MACSLFIMEQDKEIILRTYSSVWKMEKRIYSIEGLKLLFPLAMNEFVYLGISIILTFILLKLLPFLDRLHFVFKYFLMPFGMMKLFSSIKLDGKKAHKFFFDYLVFKMGPRRFAKFKPLEDTPKIIKFSGPIIFRKRKIVNKTEELIGRGEISV